MRPVISNWKVYGLEESIAASKYPFATNPDDCNSEITKTVVRLAQAPKGSGEDTFLNGIICQFDLTLPEKLWVQAERYHFFDFVSSTSTMHCITKFDLDEQCVPEVYECTKRQLKHDIAKYNECPSEEMFEQIMANIPSGFCLTARMTTNYRQLKTIYAQRKKHRLRYWREFCKELEKLPCSEFITGKEYKWD